MYMVIDRNLRPVANIQFSRRQRLIRRLVDGRLLSDPWWVIYTAWFQLSPICSKPKHNQQKMRNSFLAHGSVVVSGAEEAVSSDVYYTPPESEVAAGITERAESQVLSRTATNDVYYPPTG
jgi:hypothetical protein